MPVARSRRGSGALPLFRAQSRGKRIAAATVANPNKTRSMAWVLFEFPIAGLQVWQTNGDLLEGAIPSVPIVKDGGYYAEEYLTILP